MSNQLVNAAGEYSLKFTSWAAANELPTSVQVFTPFCACAGDVNAIVDCDFFTCIGCHTAFVSTPCLLCMWTTPEFVCKQAFQMQGQDCKDTLTQQTAQKYLSSMHRLDKRRSMSKSMSKALASAGAEFDTVKCQACNATFSSLEHSSDLF